MPQAVAGRAADDRIDRNDVHADIGRTIRPQAAQPQIVVNAAVGQNHPATAQLPAFIKGVRFIEGWKKERICRRRCYRMGD